jgi:hypothetical protein
MPVIFASSMRYADTITHPLLMINPRLSLAVDVGGMA